LDHQNNYLESYYVESVDGNVAKDFNILAISWASYIII